MMRVRRSGLAVVALVALLGMAVKVKAEVVAMVVEIHGEFGTTYTPPAGKVFIVEHISFNEYWYNQKDTKPMRVYLRPQSGTGGVSGSVVVTYSSAFNSLVRPLKIPDTSAIVVPDLGDSFYKCFLWGSLVDETDLYAAIPSEIKEFDPTSPTSFGGLIELASARPSVVKVQNSTDLENWSSDGSVAISSTTSPKQKTMDAIMAPEDTKGYYRATARAREEVLPAPQQRAQP